MEYITLLTSVITLGLTIKWFRYTVKRDEKLKREDEEQDKDDES